MEEARDEEGNPLDFGNCLNWQSTCSGGRCALDHMAQFTDTSNRYLQGSFILVDSNIPSRTFF